MSSFRYVCCYVFFRSLCVPSFVISRCLSFCSEFLSSLVISLFRQLGRSFVIFVFRYVSCFVLSFVM